MFGRIYLVTMRNICFGKDCIYDNSITILRMFINSKRNFYAKAVKRIPVWAKRPEQYSHKIIRGYFQCLELYGQVLLYQLEELCSQEDVPELFVPTFRNNYAQMKIDGAKTYGKVFEDDGRLVSIWSEVEETLMGYKSYFCE